jgi:hypothetical protein
VSERIEQLRLTVETMHHCKDTRISLSDDDLANDMLEAMDEGLDAQACVERLAGARWIIH